MLWDSHRIGQFRQHNVMVYAQSVRRIPVRRSCPVHILLRSSIHIQNGQFANQFESTDSVQISWNGNYVESVAVGFDGFQFALRLHDFCTVGDYITVEYYNQHHKDTKFE